MAMPQKFLKGRQVVRSHSSASNGSGLHRVSYLISVRKYQIEKDTCMEVVYRFGVGVVIVVGVDAVAKGDNIICWARDIAFLGVGWRPPKSGQW